MFAVALASSLVWSGPVHAELRDPNQLGITVVEARIGSLRLPYGLILGEIRQRFDRLGMVTSIRRLDGRSVLVVYIPSTHESGGMTHWLESLAITAGDGRARVYVDATDFGDRIVGLGLCDGSHRVRELESLLPGRVA